MKELDGMGTSTGPPTSTETLSESLRNTLFDDKRTSGFAVLLAGPWGSGKTWLWDNEIRVDERRPGAVISASLFGVGDLSHLGARTLAASMFQADADEGTVKAMTETAKRIGKIGKHILGRKFSLPLIGSIFEPLELIPAGALVCLDDLERVDHSMSVPAVVSAIDYLVLVRKCRVLVLSNPDGLSPGRKEEWEQYKEKVFASEFRLHPSEAAIDRVVRNAASHIGEAEISVIKSVNIGCRNNNLRRLARVTSLLDQVRHRTGREISPSLAGMVFLLATDKDSGSLRDEEYYGALPNAFHVFGARDEEQKARSKEQRDIVLRYFNSPQGYRFAPSIHALVRDGYVGPTLEAELSTIELPLAEKLVWEMQQPMAWYSLTEAEMRRWVASAEGLLSKQSLWGKIPWEVVILLLYYAELASNELGEPALIDGLESHVDPHIRACASSNPKPTLAPPGVGNITPRLASVQARFEHECEALRRARAQKIVEVMLESNEPVLRKDHFYDKAFVGALFEARAKLLTLFNSNRLFVMLALHHLEQRLEDEDDRATLAEDLLAMNTDGVGKKRLAVLSSKLSGGEDEGGSQ